MQKQYIKLYKNDKNVKKKMFKEWIIMRSRGLEPEYLSKLPGAGPLIWNKKWCL
jgi:hypothetical protein